MEYRNYLPDLQSAPPQRARCLWCGQTFHPRQEGSKPQRFCLPKCRRSFQNAARIWTEREIAEGRLSVEELRVVL